MIGSGFLMAMMAEKICQMDLPLGRWILAGRWKFSGINDAGEIASRTVKNALRVKTGFGAAALIAYPCQRLHESESACSSREMIFMNAYYKDNDGLSVNFFICSCQRSGGWIECSACTGNSISNSSFKWEQVDIYDRHQQR